MGIDLIMTLQTMLFIIVALALSAFAIMEIVTYYVGYHSPVRAEVLAEDALRKIAILEKELKEEVQRIEKAIKKLKDEKRQDNKN